MKHLITKHVKAGLKFNDRNQMDSLISYIERLELLAFFSGYPLMYAFVNLICNKTSGTKTTFNQKFIRLLPYSYALAGTLFLGHVIKDAPDFSFVTLVDQFQNSWLRIWSLLSLLFWIPGLSKKPYLSLLHSLVYFYFIVHDLLLALLDAGAINLISKDMKLYFDSLLLNILCLLI